MCEVSKGTVYACSIISKAPLCKASSLHTTRHGVSVFSPPSREQAKAHGVRAMFFIVRPNRAELIQIGNLIDTGFIRPVIETVFPLSKARQAFERGLSGHTCGKIILRVVG